MVCQINPVVNLLIDLSKAFDSVSHGILLADLLAIGCSSPVVQWFHSYISHRQQRVVNKNAFSEWKYITKGVPQGSCISPLLFNS